eukprot:7808058-Pyramimonas_sp.AAC.1
MSRIPMSNVPDMVFWRAELRGCSSSVDLRWNFKRSLSGPIPDRQDATLRLIRGVGIPKTMFWQTV